MKFGECYEHLENGGFATRRDWNGSFLWMKKRTLVKSEWCKDPILKLIADENGGSIETEQTICKYDAANKKVITGFVPQQEDLAVDIWDKFEPDMKCKKKCKGDYVGDLFEGAEVFKKP